MDDETKPYYDAVPKNERSKYIRTCIKVAEAVKKEREDAQTSLKPVAVGRVRR